MRAPASTAASRIVDLYERFAAEWDRARQRGDGRMERPWLDRFLASMPCNGGKVLDLGCGTGEPIARHLLERGCEVTGVDASPSMIEICRQRLPDASWIVADMRSLDLGSRFDGVVAWDSFFHLTPDDQRRMFSIFRAHAATGSSLMFTSGPVSGEALGSWRGEPLYHASLDSRDYRALLHANDFDVVAHMIEDPACGGHTIWLAKLRT